MCVGSVLKQEGERNNTVQPIRRTLVQAIVGRSANPDALFNVLPERGQVA